MEKVICPYCGCETIEDTFYNRPCWICKDCECLFDEEDIERQKIRRQVSILLNETDEEHPRICDIIIGENEAQGLSTLQMPHIVKCWQLPGDGTMWFYIDGRKVRNVLTKEWVEVWYELDDFDTDDMKAILEGLK